MLASDGCSEVVDTVKSACVSEEEKYVHIKNSSIRVRRCVLGEIKEKKDG